VHNNPKQCWIVIEGEVFDATNFIDCHPGEGISGQYIADHGGRDVSKLFDKYHNTEEPFEILESAKNKEEKCGSLKHGLVFVGILE